MTSRLRSTVSATTGATTMSGDRLVALSEFLVKYVPAMDHCDRSNRLLSPPLPDIARIRILRVTEEPEAKALKKFSRSIGFAQRVGSNNYPKIGVLRYGNEFGGGARRVGTSAARENRIRAVSVILRSLTIRLSDAGLRRRQTKLFYPIHRLSPWLNGDGTPAIARTDC
jgi:hypothetical protein